MAVPAANQPPTEDPKNLNQETEEKSSPGLDPNPNPKVQVSAVNPPITPDQVVSMAEAPSATTLPDVKLQNIKISPVKNKTIQGHLAAIEAKMIATEKLMADVVKLQKQQIVTEKELHQRRRELYQNTFEEYLLDKTVDFEDNDPLNDIKRKKKKGGGFGFPFLGGGGKPGTPPIKPTDPPSDLPDTEAATTDETNNAADTNSTVDVAETTGKEEKPEFDAAAASEALKKKYPDLFSDEAEAVPEVPQILPRTPITAPKPIEIPDLTEEQEELAEEGRKGQAEGYIPSFLAPVYANLSKFFTKSKALRKQGASADEAPLSGGLNTPDGGFLSVTPVGLPGNRKPRFTYKDGITWNKTQRDTKSFIQTAATVQAVMNVLGPVAGAAAARPGATTSSQARTEPIPGYKNAPVAPAVPLPPPANNVRPAGGLRKSSPAQTPVLARASGGINDVNLYHSSSQQYFRDVSSKLELPRFAGGGLLDMLTPPWLKKPQGLSTAGARPGFTGMNAQGFDAITGGDKFRPGKFKPQILGRGAYSAPTNQGAMRYAGGQSSLGMPQQPGGVVKTIVPGSAPRFPFLEQQMKVKPTTFDKGRILANKVQAGAYPRSNLAGRLRSGMRMGGAPMRMSVPKIPRMSHPYVMLAEMIINELVSPQSTAVYDQVTGPNAYYNAPGYKGPMPSQNLENAQNTMIDGTSNQQPQVVPLPPDYIKLPGRPKTKTYDSFDAPGIDLEPNVFTRPNRYVD